MGRDGALLETKALNKHFGGISALDDVDIEIRHGEILGLIGPNGAGKTTLINVVTGMMPATRGEVFFEGRPIGRLPCHRISRLGIARTFQVVKPFRHLTAKENVAVGAMFGAGGAGRSSSRALAKAEEILHLVGLGPKMDVYAEKLNVPDLKKLELAKALAMEPKLLLLDEVMSGLHATEIEAAMNLIRRINTSGTTLLVVEHVMKAVMGVCERIYVLHFGRKIAEGAARDIVSNRAVIEAYLGEKFARQEQERMGHA